MFSLKNNKQSQNISISISEHWLSVLSYNSKKNNMQSSSLVVTKNSLLSNLLLVVKKLKLRGRKCTITLLPEQYDVITVDKLAVKDEELQEAIKWNVHEKANRAVDDILVEYIEVPNMIEHSKNNKLIAFVTSKKLIYELLEYSNKAGLIVKSVSLTDISIINLLEIFCEKNNLNQSIVIFYYAHPTGGKIVVYHDRHILLIRNIVVSYTKANFNLLMGEFNRSIEFCKTTMKIEKPIVRLIGDKYITSLGLDRDQIVSSGLETLNINEIIGNEMIGNVDEEHILLLNFGIISQGMDKYVSV